MTFPQRTLLLLLVALCQPAPSRAQNMVTLPVNLDALHDRELLFFIRAAVPNIEGSRPGMPPPPWSPGGDSPRPSLDLATLAQLHAHLLENVMTYTREDERAARETRLGLERLLRAALRRAPLSDLRLTTLGDDKHPSGLGQLFPALCQRWIDEEMKKILSEPTRKLNFPANPTPLPEAYQRWIPPGPEGDARRRAAGPYAALLADLARRPARGIGAEAGSYEKLSRDFLFDRNPKVAGELLRFTWDSWCGTGAAEFGGTQMTLAFMGLLRERRLEEALGLSFFIPDSPEWLHEPGRPFDTWRNELCKLCGFDAEAIMLASGRTDFLAAAGSETAALREFARVRSELEREPGGLWRLESLAKFLVPGDPPFPDRADPRQAISPRTQAQIFDLLDQVVRDDLSFHELNQVLTVLEKLSRPETRETLRRVLRSPSTTYAARAAALLSGFGEQPDLIYPAPPVRFRLYLNEKPLRSAEHWAELVDPKGGTGSGTETLKTDADGFATVPRDLFLDPARRGARVRFSYLPPGNGNRESSEARVIAEVPMPQRFDETTEVQLIR